jgi:hypothetical protein
VQIACLNLHGISLQVLHGNLVHLSFPGLKGKPPSALADQRIICVGAGSAGMGVVKMIAQAMQVAYGVAHAC